MNDETATVTSTATLTTEAQPTTDTWTVRIVVLALACIALTVVVGTILLALKGSDESLPDTVITLGAVAVGSLGTLLASSRSVKQA